MSHVCAQVRENVRRPYARSLAHSRARILDGVNCQPGHNKNNKTQLRCAAVLKTFTDSVRQGRHDEVHVQEGDLPFDWLAIRLHENSNLLSIFLAVMALCGFHPGSFCPHRKGRDGA